MDSMQERLERIARQIEGLLAERDRIKRETERTKTRVWELEQELESWKLKYSELEETNKMLKLAKVLQPEGSDRKEIKLKINELIREIDRCIDMMSN